MCNYKNYILDWIKRVSIKQPSLGNFPICPFAKNAEYEILESDGKIIPPSDEFELIIYKLPDNLVFDEIVNIANEHNKLYPSLVFLPDGTRYTELNGIQTNNGKYNLILCQYRKNLEDARKKLINTNYYSYWDSEYLKEILKA